MGVKKFFLLGCSGLLGRHIYYALIKEKKDFICASRSKPSFIDKKLWRYIDLNKAKNTNYYCKNYNNISHIIHAAGQLPLSGINLKKSSYLNINYNSIKILCRWAIKKKIVLIFISGVILSKDNLKKFITSKENFKYINSKKIAEDYVLKQRSKGLKLVIIRPTSIYGWGIDKNKLLSKLLFFKNKQINFNFKNNYLYNFVHAYDVARLVLHTIKYKILGNFSIGGVFLDVYNLTKKIFYFRRKNITINYNIQNHKLINIYKFDSKPLKKIKFYNKISFKKGINLTIKKKVL